MTLADYDYDLPPERIAQSPLARRDASRLMRLGRCSGAISQHRFWQLPELLSTKDLLVINNTRVLPARLAAHKAGSGGAVEILLLRRLDSQRWRALVGGRKLGIGQQIELHAGGISGEIVYCGEKSERVIRFSQPLDKLLPELGQTPLPPYIREQLADGERYQTVYNAVPGSAAAPTAGLHFTADLLQGLEKKGIGVAQCTLHIGLGTFQPLSTESAAAPALHSEYAALDAENAARIQAHKSAGGRIIAVGTTSARTLESAALHSPAGTIAPFAGDTDLFIKPGYRWQIVDGIISNFHLPRSSLLMMLSSFAGRDRLLRAYARAIALGYRFYSFGDAMLVI